MHKTVGIISAVTIAVAAIFMPFGTSLAPVLNGLTYRDGDTPVATVALPEIDGSPAGVEEQLAPLQL